MTPPYRPEPERKADNDLGRAVVVWRTQLKPQAAHDARQRRVAIAGPDTGGGEFGLGCGKALLIV